MAHGRVVFFETGTVVEVISLFSYQFPDGQYQFMQSHWLLMYSSAPAFRQRSRSPAIACESPVIKITAGVFRKQVVQAFLAGAQGVFCYFLFSVLEMVEGFCKYLPLASQIAAALTIRSKMLPSLRTISNLRSLSQQPFVQLPQGGF